MPTTVTWGPAEGTDIPQQSMHQLIIHWIDLILFSQTFGFLVMKIEPRTPDLSIDQLRHLLGKLRKVRRGPRSTRDPQLSLAINGNPLVGSIRDLIDFLLQGLTRGASLKPQTSDPREFMAGIQARPECRYTTTANGMTYGQQCRLMSYTCVTSRQDPKARPSSDELDQVLYELATCGPTVSANDAHRETYRQQLLQDSRIAFWKGWTGLAHPDHIVFLAHPDSHFATFQLPLAVETQYFYMYVLALYQRLRLFNLAGDLLRSETGLDRNLKGTRQAWRSLLSFRNYFWFTDVTLRTQGSDLYQLFQRTCDVHRLFDEVRQEAQDLKDYYENRMADHTQRLLYFLTVVGVPLGVLAEIFSGNMIQPPSLVGFMVTTSFVLMLSWLAGKAWWAYKDRTN